MGRTPKAHGERKNEILDGAWHLFTTRGYEGTTVQALIDMLGIAKGTFYHYFKSKEQVLEAIADRLGEEALAEMWKVIDAPDLEAGPKLNRFIEVARSSRMRGIDSFIQTTRVLHREENLIIRHKISDRLMELTLPALRSIIEQGVREGCFEVSDIDEGARFFWLLSNTFGELQTKTLLSTATADQRVEEMVRRANFVTQSLDRVLGAEDGTIAKPSPETLRFFVSAVDAEKDLAPSNSEPGG